MASHADLLTELQLLEKVPTLERLRAAQKRRAQQLKKWAQYEQDLQHRKRKHERKRSAGGRRKKVSFEASVALLEASLRNDAEEGRRPASGRGVGSGSARQRWAGALRGLREGGRAARPSSSAPAGVPGKLWLCFLDFFFFLVVVGNKDSSLWLMNTIIISLPSTNIY